MLPELHERYRVELFKAARYFGVELSELTFSLTDTGNLTGTLKLNGVKKHLPKVTENSNLRYYACLLTLNTQNPEMD